MTIINFDIKYVQSLTMAPCFYFECLIPPAYLSRLSVEVALVFVALETHI